MSDFATELTRIAALAAPIMLSNLFGIFAVFAAIAMLGNYSTLHLATVAIGSSIVIPLTTASAGLLRAATPIAAERAARRDFVGAGRVVQQAAWLGLILAALSAGCVLCAMPIITALGVRVPSPELLQAYLRVVCLGIPGSIGAAVLTGLCGAFGRMVPLFAATVVAAIVAVSTASLFVSGSEHTPALGAVGAALATALGWWTSFLVMVVWTATSSTFRKAALYSSWSRPAREQLALLIKLGVPIAATVFAKFSTFAALALLITPLGAVALSAHQLALNVAEIAFMLPIAVGQAAMIRVGQAMGSGSSAAALRAWRTGLSFSLMISLSIAVALLVARQNVAFAYTIDEQVASAAVVLLLLVAVQQIPEGLQVTAGFALIGFKDTRVSLLAILIGYWAIAVPLGYVLAFYAKLGVTGFWLGLLAGIAAVCGIQVGRLVLVSRRTALAMQSQLTPEIP